MVAAADQCEQARSVIFDRRACCIGGGQDRGQDRSGLIRIGCSCDHIDRRCDQDQYFQNYLCLKKRAKMCQNS